LEDEEVGEKAGSHKEKEGNEEEPTASGALEPFLAFVLYKWFALLFNIIIDDVCLFVPNVL